MISGRDLAAAEGVGVGPGACVAGGRAADGVLGDLLAAGAENPTGVGQKAVGREVATEAAERAFGHARARRVVDVSGEAGVGVFDRAEPPLGVIKVRVDAVVGHIARRVVGEGRAIAGRHLVAGSSINHRAGGGHGVGRRRVGDGIGDALGCAVAKGVVAPAHRRAGEVVQRSRRGRGAIRAAGQPVEVRGLPLNHDKTVVEWGTAVLG